MLDETINLNDSLEESNQQDVPDDGDLVIDLDYDY